MLTVFDGNESGGSMSRRRLLEIGGLGLGGLSLSQLLSTKALASGQPNPLTGKSVIFFFNKAARASSKHSIPNPTRLRAFARWGMWFPLPSRSAVWRFDESAGQAGTQI